MAQHIGSVRVEEVGLDSVVEQYARQCSAEPIHLLGRVQPHGFVLVVDVQTEVVVQASSGVVRHLPSLRSVDHVLATALEEWVLPPPGGLSKLLQGLPADFCKIVDLQLALPSTAPVPTYECLGHRSGVYAILEWIPKEGVSEAEQLESQQMLQLSRAVTRLRQAGTLEDFYQDCVREMQALSGYDHVMLYRFLPDWSGEVVAEQASPGRQQKFLGMRFPPGDIPPQARALYEANTLRVLADVDAVPDVIVPALLPKAQPLDLSHSLLRGMSQSHMIYLRNMGVRATLTISLLREGKLWGLLACHHHEPRVPRGEVREVLRSSCDLIASLVTMQIEHMDRVNKSNRNAAFVHILSSLSQGLVRGDHFVDCLAEVSEELCQAFGSNNFGMRLGQLEFVASEGVGGTHTRRVLDSIALHCESVLPGRVPGVHVLRADRHGAIADLSDAAGLLMVRLPLEQDGFCFFTRTAQVENVRWAGRPDALTTVTHEGQVRLEPRRSFASCEQEVWGGAKAWDEADMDAITRLGTLLCDAYRNQLNRDLQKQLHWRAHHDHLTGLLNRSVVEQELTRRLAASGARVALFLIDLDHFKRINDTLGHSVGDTVLREIGSRFASATRGNDVIARLGGDEFLLFSDLTDTAREQCQTIAERLHESMVGSIDVLDKSLTLSVSVGVAFSPDHGLDASNLLRHADLALYEAKARGRACTALFDHSLEGQILNSVELEDQLRFAIGGQQLRLFYQPKVDLQTLQVVGFEALVRWQHPGRGLLTPDHFIPMAERSQLINGLGRWVIDEAMAQLVRWRNEGMPVQPIAVNVSFVQIVSGSLLRDLRECSVRHGVDLRLLEVELTETVVMENTQQTVDMLSELAQLGVRVSLDDFGTGYSSLAYVQQLPLDALKIDRSFISQLERGGQSQVVTSGIIGLAHGLKLATVAEGVETREQWTWLRANGCRTAQGYLFSRPVPASDIPAAILAIESLNLNKA